MYVNQEDRKPIRAKDYLIKNWRKYRVADTKEDFIALLNILQACGENLDSLHDAYINGADEFCDIVRWAGWDSDQDVANTLFEFCTFYREKDFIDMILERREDYDTSEEWANDIINEASDDINACSDVQITKTDDGYVRRVWY